MRHRKKGKRLGRTKGHRKALLKNLAGQLLDSGRMVTTVAKAKFLREVVEPLITRAKRGTLHDRRQVGRVISDRMIIKKLFNEVAGLYKSRNGGYTRIIRYGARRGDNAELAVIEMVDREKVYSIKKKSDTGGGKGKKGKREGEEKENRRRKEDRDKKKEEKDKKKEEKKKKANN